MKKSIIILGLIFALSSCTNENHEIDRENQENVASFKDYFKLMQDTKALIAISSVSSMESTENMYTISSVIKGNGNPYDISLNNQNFNYQNNNLSNTADISSWCDTKKDLSAFYGKNLKIELVNNTINTKTSISNKDGEDSDLYIPELLNVEVKGLVNGKITNGTTIIWNADPKNTKGVIISVEYCKMNQSNQSIAENNIKDIVRGSTISDSGSYTITSKDLSYFANDASLTFSIGRAGYTIKNQSEGDNDVVIGAYTIVRANYHIKK